MSVLSSVIADILHITGIVLICKSYLQLREKTDDKYRYLKILIIAIIASLIINVVENKTITLMIYLLCIGIILYICYAENNKKIIVCAIWSSIVVELIELMAILLVNTIEIVTKYSNNELGKVLASIVSLAFIYVVSLLLKGITNEGIRTISIKYLGLLTFNVFANFCVLELLIEVTLEEMAYRNRIVYIIICIAVTVGLCIEMVSVMLLLISRNIYREKELIIKQYLEEQVKQYEYLNEREKETKKFRHDIRGHLYFLNKLKKEEKNHEFEDYLQDIIDRVDDLGNSINVGNDIVNAVLNRAYAEAESKNIKINVVGHFPSQCNISAYNLCTIFFNLLNNAIEAADKTEKKEVWVMCQYTEKVIIVEIGNYYCDGNKLDKNRLQTSKSEKEYHGWGMKNVEDSVEECKGLMDIEIKDGKFIVSITLKNEKEDITK